MVLNLISVLWMVFGIICMVLPQWTTKIDIPSFKLGVMCIVVAILFSIQNLLEKIRDQK